MHIWKRSAKITAAAGLVLFAVGLLLESKVVSAGIRVGLSACVQTLIPALFPFLCLSGFLSISEYGGLLARPLRPLWRHVFRIPDEAGAVFLLSLVGGYPVGAKGIATLLERGAIDRKTAARMLCFCVNCGPSFLITAVGMGMLFQRSAGVILFISQTAATLLIGIVISLWAPKPKRRAAPPAKEKAGTALVQAVSGGVTAMLTLCAFAVLCSGILYLVRDTGITGWISRGLGLHRDLAAVVLSGIFEVTSGCIAASGVDGATGFLLLSCFVSFGGLSVMLQVVACFRERIRFLPFLLARLVHMPLAAMIALPLWRRFCGVTTAHLPQGTPIPRADSSVLLSTLCLIGMCTILLVCGHTSARLHKRLN